MKNVVFLFVLFFSFGVLATDQSVDEANMLIQTPEVNAKEIKTKETSNKDIGISNTKESEILVKLDGKKADTATQESGMRLILTFSILGILGCGGYFLIRKYRFSNLNVSRANEIKVLTQHHLGPKRSIALVRVAGESMLIGVTDHNINLIKSLSLLDEEIPEMTPRRFESVFDSRTGEVNDLGQSGQEDDFSISGIKDFVSKRLKNMRNIH